MVLNELNKVENDVSLIDSNELVKLESISGAEISVYPKSINSQNDVTYFIGKNGIEKYLYIIAPNESLLNGFNGEVIKSGDSEIVINQ